MTHFIVFGLLGLLICMGLGYLMNLALRALLGAVIWLVNNENIWLKVVVVLTLFGGFAVWLVSI